MSLYKIMATPNEGYGVFATERIPARTAIMEETALLELDHEPVIRVYKQFLRLFKRMRQDYFSYTMAENVEQPLSREDSVVPEATPESRGGTTGVVGTSKLKQYADTLVEQDIGTDSVGIVGRVEEGATVVAIFHNNAWKIRNQFNTADMLGFFPRAARMNHSCDPNTVHG